MSFLSGFFGGSGDSTSSKADTTVNTTTTTTSTYRDIGFTGADAVALADVTGGAGVEITRIGSDTLKQLSQDVGDSYNQLIGGASNLISSASARASETLNAGNNASRDILSEAGAQAKTLIDSAQSTAARVLNPQDNTPLYVALAITAVALFLWRK